MHKLLSGLEKELQSSNDTDDAVQLKFVKNKQTTLYPLHSLRVSLITAYALEGGVPMPILSKCIAGHARLVMTLYYTKAGITYVSEKMNEAEEQLIAGNAWMRLLINRAGSLKDAVPYLEGRKKLAEIGLERELDDVLELSGVSASLLTDNNGAHPQHSLLPPKTDNEHFTSSE